MPASLTCPQCGAALQVAAHAVAGKKIRCPSCQSVFTAPERETAIAEPEVVSRVPAPLPTARRAAVRPERGRAYDEAETDEVPRRRPAGGKSNTGLLVGLLAGGGLLLLACAGLGIGSLVWYRASRTSYTVAGPAAPAGPNAPFVPPNLNPPGPGPNVGGPGANVPPQQRQNQGAGNQTLLVVVAGIRDGKVGDYVFKNLERRLPPTHSIQSHSTGGVMEVTLYPAGDARAFANDIDFGTVTRVEGHVIYVTVTDDAIRPALAPPTPRPARLPHEPPPIGDLPGLVSSWSFDEGNGDRAGNTAGRREPALLHNTKWMPGVRGKCLSFKAPDSYVDLGTSDDLNFPARSAFAVSAWVQPARPSGTVLSLRNSDDESADLDITLDAGQLHVTFRPDKNLFGPVASLASDKVDDGNWHHFVVQRQADGRLELYVDGIGVQTVNTDGGPLTTNLRALGRERFWVEKVARGDGHYEGCIDEVCVFKQALSAAEIRKLAGQE